MKPPLTRGLFNNHALDIRPEHQIKDMIALNTASIVILAFLALGLTLYWVSQGNKVYHKGETLLVTLESSKGGQEMKHHRMVFFREGVEDRKGVFDKIDSIVEELELTRDEVVVTNAKFVK